MRKRIIITGLVLILLILGYNYIYQGHRNIQAETAEFELNSDAIIEAFTVNSKEAESTYINKTIIISGQVSEQNIGNVTLDDNIFCQLLDSSIKPIEKNTQIRIKGRVIGYDDLLEQVKLDQCHIITHPKLN